MPGGATRVEEARWRGEPAVRLRAGDTTFAVLPHLGLTGVSLRVRGLEFLATPGGPAALRAGHTLGLPLLAPWANRLDPRGYRVAGVTVDLRRRALHRDANGLPIHGLLVGAVGWRVLRAAARRGTAELAGAIDVDAPAFPFPHRIEVAFRLRARRLDVQTTVIPTGRRRVPVAFGWHPYLRLPRTPRTQWRLHLPARERLVLDGRSLPTGARERAPAECAPIGRRTFDDLYALGRDRMLAIESDFAAIGVRGDRAHPFAQVWVPPGKPFAALEPMTVATNSLATGAVPLVSPGDAFSGAFSMEPVLR